MSDILEFVGDDYNPEFDEYDYDLSGPPVAATGPQMVRKQYTAERRQMLPFGTTGSLAAGDSIDLLGNPQVPFRPERLVVQEISTTGALVIDDIKVGKNSQFISAGSFPSSLFEGNSNEGLFSFDTARPGIDIVISLTNADAATALVAIVGMVGKTANR